MPVVTTFTLGASLDTALVEESVRAGAEPGLEGLSRLRGFGLAASEMGAGASGRLGAGKEAEDGGEARLLGSSRKGAGAGRGAGAGAVGWGEARLRDLNIDFLPA